MCVLNFLGRLGAAIGMSGPMSIGRLGAAMLVSPWACVDDVAGQTCVPMPM